jgi:hypothetical protein
VISETRRSRIARYQQFAKLAAEQAWEADNPGVRDQFLDIEKSWLDLATTLARKSN